MKASIYKIIEIIGTSDVSWEEAVTAYRARVDVSFKYEGS
jgi:flavin-binding protein dodecin